MSNPLKDAGLSLKELKSVAKTRDTKGYNSMSKDELLDVINPSKQTSFFKAKIEENRKEFNESRYKFSKLKKRRLEKIFMK